MKLDSHLNVSLSCWNQSIHKSGWQIHFQDHLLTNCTSKCLVLLNYFIIQYNWLVRFYLFPWLGNPFIKKKIEKDWKRAILRMIFSQFIHCICLHYKKATSTWLQKLNVNPHLQFSVFFLVFRDLGNPELCILVGSKDILAVKFVPPCSLQSQICKADTSITSECV